MLATGAYKTPGMPLRNGLQGNAAGKSWTGDAMSFWSDDRASTPRVRRRGVTPNARSPLELTVSPFLRGTTRTEPGTTAPPEDFGLARGYSPGADYVFRPDLPVAGLLPDGPFGTWKRGKLVTIKG